MTRWGILAGGDAIAGVVVEGVDPPEPEAHLIQKRRETMLGDKSASEADAGDEAQLPASLGALAHE